MVIFDQQRENMARGSAENAFADHFLWGGSRSGYGGADAAATAADTPTAAVVGNSCIYTEISKPFERSPESADRAQNNFRDEEIGSRQ